jgi:two-component system response regulator MprA
MNERILILDDEPLVLTAVEKALSRTNYRVKAVSDAEAYREALSGEDFDLIVLDMHLPGITTQSLIDEARSRNPKVRILFMSGSGSPSGAEHFLQKPFRIEDLRNLVRKVLDEPGRP